MGKSVLTPSVGHVNSGVKIEKKRTPVALICIFIKQAWKEAPGISNSRKWVEGSEPVPRCNACFPCASRCAGHARSMPALSQVGLPVTLRATHYSHFIVKKTE